MLLSLRCPRSNPIWMVATRMQAMSRTKPKEQAGQAAAAAAAAEAGQETEPKLPALRASIAAGGLQLPWAADEGQLMLAGGSRAIPCLPRMRLG